MAGQRSAQEGHMSNQKTKSYPLFIPPRIPADPTTRKLYKLEDLARESIQRAVNELRNVLDIENSRYWTHALPRELESILDSIDHRASITAAVVFLRNHGYNVDHTDADVEQ
jgi:restriction endonuclease Mrr